jgi:hypothetical protein
MLASKSVVHSSLPLRGPCCTCTHAGRGVLAARWLSHRAAVKLRPEPGTGLRAVRSDSATATGQPELDTTAIQLIADIMRSADEALTAGLAHNGNEATWWNGVSSAGPDLRRRVLTSVRALSNGLLEREVEVSGAIAPKTPWQLRESACHAVVIDQLLIPVAAYSGQRPACPEFQLLRDFKCVLRVVVVVEIPDPLLNYGIKPVELLALGVGDAQNVSIGNVEAQVLGLARIWQVCTYARCVSCSWLRLRASTCCCWARLALQSPSCLDGSMVCCCERVVTHPAAPFTASTSSAC